MWSTMVQEYVPVEWQIGTSGVLLIRGTNQRSNLRL
jgi:hypothetical protein